MAKPAEITSPPLPTTTGSPAAISRRWALLVALSVLLAVALEMLHLPAALLLGPMIAAILLSANGVKLKLARPLFIGAQAIIGCLIARVVNPSILGTIFSHAFLFLGSVLAVIATSAVLGWLLTRWRVLPGTTAVWGSSPGAASAMAIVAAAYGADIRLVAFMQYLRVVLVVATASVVARIWTGPLSHQAASVVWFPHLLWPAFPETLALAALGAIAGRALRIPAGALLVPMTLGIALHGAGWMEIDLPPWLLAVSYALVGWSIGLNFDPAILTSATRALPQLVASIAAQILLCGGLAFLLTRFAGIEPLTAYLATSPGGADSVAIISASSKVDMPFVMALQTVRFLLVLATGPALARFIAERTGVRDEVPAT